MAHGWKPTRARVSLPDALTLDTALQVLFDDEMALVPQPAQTYCRKLVEPVRLWIPHAARR